MIDFSVLEENIKSNKIDNKYIMFGFNESLIKENIKNISKKQLDINFFDLNYVQFDGITAKGDEIINACETLPFMDSKRIVVVYRAVFLEDDGKQQGVSAEDTFKKISSYIDKVPEHCTLILYYVFDEKRDKASKKVKGLEKKCTVVEFKQLKNVALQKKVKLLFDERNQPIEKAELSLFCSGLDNNMDIIINEVEKLCCYALGRPITKEDIFLLAPPKSDSDIFNLVDYVSQKNTKVALDILNELLFRGEKFPVILSMIERQFKIILGLKLGEKKGKNIEILSKELRLNPYIAEKMLAQSKKFTEEKLMKVLGHCLESERILKSSSVDVKTELEKLLIKIALV